MPHKHTHCVSVFVCVCMIAMPSVCVCFAKCTYLPYLMLSGMLVSGIEQFHFMISSNIELNIKRDVKWVYVPLSIRQCMIMCIPCTGVHHTHRIHFKAWTHSLVQFNKKIHGECNEICEHAVCFDAKWYETSHTHSFSSSYINPLRVLVLTAQRVAVPHFNP